MKKKEMIPPTDEENKSYKKQEVYYICQRGFITDDINKESEIIVTTKENMKELLIVFMI